jgi:hypothetical protein
MKLTMPATRGIRTPAPSQQNQGVQAAVSHGDSQNSSLGPDLQRILAAWPRLPVELRRAILSIAESVRPVKEGTP